MSSAPLHPLWRVLLLTVALLGAGCARESDVVTLRLAHSLDTSHPVHRAMEVMARELAEASGGKVRMKIYANSQLGSEREMIELVQLGAIDMVKTSTAPLEGFVPDMAVFGVPYVFRDEDQYWGALDGVLGRQLLQSGEDKWLKGLCYYDAGSRSFYTRDKTVEKPADLRGLKIRVQNSRTAIQMVEAMGGAPTPIAFGELYTALDQGVVDGAENNPQSLLTSRHYEVCRFYTLDEHTRVPDILLISTERWERLSPEVRAMVQAAADVSARFQREQWKEDTEQSLAKLEASGVKILRPDKTLFQEAVQSVHAIYRGTRVGELIEEIRRLP